MIIAENILDEFKLTMSSLEKGLQVIHITTPASQLLCCQEEENIQTVLVKRSDLKQFDQIPVKRQNTIVGLLLRRNCPEGAEGVAGKHMEPLGENLLVSANTSLIDFIQKGSFDRIVIGGMEIYGLVTRSDLLKLPVFLLGFALTTHAETLMLHIIRETDIRSEEWLKWIDGRHRHEIKRNFAQLSRERLDPDILELTYITDKSTILEHLAALEKYVDFLPDKSYIDRLHDITAFRNSIAHTGHVSDNAENLQEFIQRLLRTYEWIQDIEQWLKVKASITH